MKTVKFPSEKELKTVRKQLSRGNASEALSLSASPVEKAKYKLCEKFVIYKREKNVSQKELAEILGIDEALVSKILRYKIKDFTTDRLIKFLSKLYETIEVNVNVATKSQKFKSK